MRIAAAIFIAIVFLAVFSTGWLAGKSDARANIYDYLSKGPNDFYPGQHDVPGTAIYLDIAAIGWNATRVIGNLGIGDGSPAIFDRTSTMDVEYPDWGFMCGDVSQQPWMPGMKNLPESTTNESGQGGNTTEGNAAGNYTIGNATGSQSPVLSDNVSRNMDVFNASRPIASKSAGNVSQNATITPEQAAATGENLTYDAYHPMQYLSPVRDVLYEHPLATPGTAYCQLLGFVPPSGIPVNVGMKCTGYGY